MARRPPLLALLLALAAAAATASGAGVTLQRQPDPLPPETPLTVTATFPAPVASAHLNVCAADGHENVTYCYLPQAMEQGEDGAWTATTPRGYRGGQQLGVNVTATLTEGGQLAYPEGSDYEFFTVQSAGDATLPVPALASLAAMAVAAVALGRWRRG